MGSQETLERLDGWIRNGLFCCRQNPYRTVKTVFIIHTFARLMLVTFHTDALVFPVVVSRRVSVTSFLLKVKSFFLKVKPPDCLKPARQGFFFVFTSSFFFSCFCFRNSSKRSNLSSTAVFFFFFSELLRTGTIFWFALTNWGWKNKNYISVLLYLLICISNLIIWNFNGFGVFVKVPTK